MPETEERIRQKAGLGKANDQRPETRDYRPGSGLRTILTHTHTHRPTQPSRLLRSHVRLRLFQRGLFRMAVEKEEKEEEDKEKQRVVVETKVEEEEED